MPEGWRGVRVLMPEGWGRVRVLPMSPEDGLIECVSATALADVVKEFRTVQRYLAEHNPDSTGAPPPF